MKKKPQETKSRILRTAIRLFNDKGSQQITTNHIAQEMGISPGNLYYHYQNKEEIIREIFKLMASDMDGTWDISEPLSIMDFKSSMIKVQHILWKYRFFQKEQNYLLTKDTVLKKDHLKARNKRFKEITLFFQGLTKSGAMRGFEDETILPSLIKIGWIIVDYWMSFLDIEGEKIDEENAKAGVDLLLLTLRPYMSQKALSELE
jgi:AcrR family transcriptional regulator